MIQTGFESRVKVQQVINSQLPEFILDESPKAVDFLKQYYISQEYQGGPTDIVENLDQYLKVDNLTPEVVVGFTTLSTGISSSANTIQVSTTRHEIQASRASLARNPGCCNPLRLSVAPESCHK